MSTDRATLSHTAGRHGRLTRAYVVPRQSLLDALVGSPHRLTLIEASAGFGKTTLLEQWSHAESQSGTTVVRISCEPKDRDAQEFFKMICEAFIAAGLDVASLLELP
jgi:LuxR family transcriptional regulator, maltose regulon positive regulatory protein